MLSRATGHTAAHVTTYLGVSELSGVAWANGGCEQAQEHAYGQ